MSETQSGPKCKKCQNDIWEILWETAECTNCGTERPYHRRRGHNGKQTPSQTAALARIANYFTAITGIADMARWEANLLDYGTISLAVETTDNIYTLQGGHFFIGRRGGIECMNVYGLSENKDEIKKYYNRI